MNDTPTVQFVKALENLKAGDLSLLKQMIGRDLDESLLGFDLFTGLWWKQRKNSPRTPRRDVSWLIALLYAEYRFQQADGADLPTMLGKICGKISKQRDKRRFISRFDLILQSNVSQLEQALIWALNTLRDNAVLSLDWVILTDNLSAWNNDLLRQKWAETFISATDKKNEGESTC